jgi:RNA polymerase sigma-70 factor (ECF subfamily)
MASQKFHTTLVNSMPKMRTWALALTRNRAAADDLVQETAVRALKAAHTFNMETNFSAWVHRIMFNQFISGIRSKREFNDLDQVPEMAISATQQDSVDLRDLSREFDRLPDDQREALMMVVLQERDYDEVSESTGCPVGTLKSRVHRGRLTLRARMNGEPVRLAA